MRLNMRIVCMIQYFCWSILNVSAENLICNEDSFNTSTHLCCGGTVFPLRDEHNTVQSCCMVGEQSPKVAELYNEDTHFCCDVVRPKHDGDGNEWHCCNGNKPYKKDEHICCGNHREPLNNSDGTHECCGGKFYNFKSQVCCNNTLHQRKENQTDEEQMDCCGDERYDARNLRCEHKSEDYPKLVSVDLGTCHNMYNMTTHICCDDKVTPFPELHKRHNYSCCGDKPFDTKHISNAVAIVISFQNQKNAVGMRCCSDVPNNVSSLGGKSKCCGTRLIPVYDICCNGIPGGLNVQCCGEKLISKKEICCEGQALEPSKICCKEQNGATKQIGKGKVSDNDCCIYRKHHKQIYKPYDQMNQICHKGVFEKSTIPTKTGTIFNSTTPLTATRKLGVDGFQAYINLTCNRKMNSKDLRVLKIRHDNGKLILRVQQEGNLLAGERRNFQVILNERIQIQLGKMYRIYTTRKIGLTKKFYKSGKDVLIRRNKKNIRRLKKLCEVKSILERSLQHS
ncbi:hypothetical protein ACJMK2_037589 [Sinanodonta woodiana]|uniref:Galaxin-like repeats domain-containing protein n=1 Tax=Sinanodonta woodiana TaxID=1069815 RepID=A0ABD3WMR8_SINWO